MNLFKYSLAIIFTSFVSLFFAQIISADTLEIDGNKIDVNGTITSTQISEKHIYIGGQFTTVSINKQDTIERVNIVEIEKANITVTNWNPKPDGPIHDLALYKNTLIVAGQFSTFDTKAKQYIVSVDLNTKEVIDNLIITDQPVYALSINEDTLYVGGDFEVINGVARKYLTSYNLVSNSLSLWNPVLNAGVYEILIFNDVMYVGGGFTTVNEKNNASIVAFDVLTGEKIEWNPELKMSVTHIEAQDQKVIVTGFIRLNDQVVAKRVIVDSVTAAVISEEEVTLDPIGTVIVTNLTSEEKSSELIVNEEELGFKIPSLGDLLTFAIRGFFVIAGLSALFYLLLGAFSWVTSGGDQDSITAARNKIQAAIVGLLIMVAVLSLVWTLERVIFDSRICLGVSCPITIPTLLKSSE